MVNVYISIISYRNLLQVPLVVLHRDEGGGVSPAVEAVRGVRRSVLLLRGSGGTSGLLLQVRAGSGARLHSDNL